MPRMNAKTVSELKIGDPVIVRTRFKSIEYSGWLNTDAVNLVSCPRCGSKPGENCKSPKGRRAFSPHGERTRQLRAEHPKAWEKARRKPGVNAYAKAMDRRR